MELYTKMIKIVNFVFRTFTTMKKFEKKISMPLSFNDN